MSDALDQAIQAAAAQPEQPQAIRLEIKIGNGKPPAVMILPVPVTEIDLFPPLPQPVVVVRRDGAAARRGRARVSPRSGQRAPATSTATERPLMAATISASTAGGTVTVTGSGYTGPKVPLAVAFTSTDGKRRLLELRETPVVAGAINVDVPVPYTSGTVVVKTVDPATAAALATSSGQSV